MHKAFKFTGMLIQAHIYRNIDWYCLPKAALTPTEHEVIHFDTDSQLQVAVKSPFCPISANIVTTVALLHRNDGVYRYLYTYVHIYRKVVKYVKLRLSDSADKRQSKGIMEVDTHMRIYGYIITYLYIQICIYTSNISMCLNTNTCAAF